MGWVPTAERCRRHSGGVGNSAAAVDGEPMVGNGHPPTTQRVHQLSCSNQNVPHASRFAIAVASNICQILECRKAGAPRRRRAGAWTAGEEN